jgi:hypothetical protein
MPYEKIKINKIFFLMKKHTNIFIRNIIDSGKLTCYPEEERKNKIQIFFDNLIWLFRFHQSNENYYLLGFDRKNFKRYKQKYISGRKCAKLIYHKKNQFNRNADKYNIIVHDKFVSAQYMASLGFPAPKTIALVNNEYVTLTESGEEFPLDFLKSEKKELIKDCICKPVDGWCGIGVFQLSIKEGKLFLNNKESEYQKLRDLFSASKYLIQERIIQHKKMAGLNPHCVNTIRLVTCFADNRSIEPFAAFIRIGIGENITDNWHAGGIIVRLNTERGCLEGSGFTMLEHGGKKYERHPETGVKFDGYAIPFCNQAIDLATKLHKYYYCIHSIGWDIAITETGPVFIEANQSWGPDSHFVVEDNFMDKFTKYFK